METEQNMRNSITKREENIVLLCRLIENHEIRLNLKDFFLYDQLGKMLWKMQPVT